MKYLYITNNPKIAAVLDKNDVVPWIDLEINGKQERQKGRNTVISNHKVSDIKAVKEYTLNNPLLVRINPINENSKEEIDSVLDAGADYIMLPMFYNKNDVEKFLNIVNGRCKTVLLIETKEAVENINSILRLGGINRVHIGLNDLHLSYGLNFMFKLYSNGTVEKLCDCFKKYKIPFGIGGVANIGQGFIPGEFVLTEQKRLGSSCTILSRSFCDTSEFHDVMGFKKVFESELLKLRNYENAIQYCSSAFYDKNRDAMYTIINKIEEKQI